MNITQLGQVVNHSLFFFKFRIELRDFLFVVFDDFMEIVELTIDAEMIES